jgi:RNA polymerase sigma-70 factor (ECF subfamily)
MLQDELILIEKARQGDAQAFEELVIAYQDKVFNICRYMLGPDDAEDAAQDSFVKAYKNLDRFTPSPGFSAWITRIAINTCLDYKRKPSHLPLAGKSPDGDEYEHEHASPGPGPEAMLSSKQSAEAVASAVGRLSDKLRAVLVLCDIEGLSYTEASDALGISMGTVKSRLSRAREELRRLFGHTREHI